MHGHISVRSFRTLEDQFFDSFWRSWMFDCCRVPGEGFDWSISYSKPGDLGNSGHIVVIRQNRAWRIDVTPEGRILSTEEIQKYVSLVNIKALGLTGKVRMIQYIYDNTLEEYPGVGILSASDRDVWAKVCSS
jgi:carnitine O-acetyltransferase